VVDFVVIDCRSLVVEFDVGEVLIFVLVDFVRIVMIRVDVEG